MKNFYEDEINYLEELEHDEKFHKEFEAWSEINEVWEFEELENYAKEYFERVKIN